MEVPVWVAVAVNTFYIFKCLGWRVWLEPPRGLISPPKRHVGAMSAWGFITLPFNLQCVNEAPVIIT
ncbi:hypothetical protein HanIR_Chr15g0733811 [Helianthus annuus]|nr:hypothetical protein HanIR_Chr15g0733811 [Helianthus annuus]